MEKCKFCDETEQLEEHHVVPRRFGGSDKKENLVKVCPTCHSKLEDLYGSRFYDELGVKKKDNIGDRGWYLIHCRTCDRRSIDFKPVRSGSLECGTCEGNSVFIEYRINEEFAEVVDLENFADESGKDYYVWAKFTEEYTGKLADFVYPRGQEPISFDSKESAYDRAAKLMLKDWCKETAVFTATRLSDYDDPVLSEFFSRESRELSRLEDKVVNAISTSPDGCLTKKEICEEVSLSEFKVNNILDGLKKQGIVVEDEKGFKAEVSA